MWEKTRSKRKEAKRREEQDGHSAVKQKPVVTVSQNAPISMGGGARPAWILSFEGRVRNGSAACPLPDRLRNASCAAACGGTTANLCLVPPIPPLGVRGAPPRPRDMTHVADAVSCACEPSRRRRAAAQRPPTPHDSLTGFLALGTGSGPHPKQHFPGPRSLSCPSLGCSQVARELMERVAALAHASLRAWQPRPA